jgi:Asp-tRNA(Asn)/Glu-tRNA(Gln) amidotransferase B subunit
MKSVRLINFGVEHPQLDKDPSILKSGKKRFGEFKNKISISMLSSIPVYELEKNLEYDMRKSRQLIKELKSRPNNLSAIDGIAKSIDPYSHRARWKREDYSYFNENIKEIYPKPRYASVGRDLRMGSYAFNMLNK